MAAIGRFYQLRREVGFAERRIDDNLLERAFVDNARPGVCHHPKGQAEAAGRPSVARRDGERRAIGRQADEPARQARLRVEGRAPGAVRRAEDRDGPAVSSSLAFTSRKTPASCARPAAPEIAGAT